MWSTWERTLSQVSSGLRRLAWRAQKKIYTHTQAHKIIKKGKIKSHLQPNQTQMSLTVLGFYHIWMKRWAFTPFRMVMLWHKITGKSKPFACLFSTESDWIGNQNYITVGIRMKFYSRYLMMVFCLILFSSLHATQVEVWAIFTRTADSVHIILLIDSGFFASHLWLFKLLLWCSQWETERSRINSSEAHCVCNSMFPASLKHEKTLCSRGRCA